MRQTRFQTSLSESLQADQLHKLHPQPTAHCFFFLHHINLTIHPHGQCVFPHSAVWYWFTFPYHIEDTDIYIYSRPVFPLHPQQTNHLQRRSRPPHAAHLPPVRPRPAVFRWLAGTSVSAAPKNCLFVLTITHWCFSFNFSSLSKAITQFQVFQGSEVLET